MPTYEYACRSCGHHLEAVQSFTDEPLATCPDCGGQLRKVFGTPGIVLKGSGFYKNDSRAAKNGKGERSGGKEPAGEGATENKDGKGSKAAKESDQGSTKAGSDATSSKESKSRGSDAKSATSGSTSRQPAST